VLPSIKQCREKKQLEEGMKEGRMGAVFSEEVEKT